MSEGTIYKEPIKSPFDILTSQIEKEGSHKDEFRIPIKKIFEKVPQPTELEPLSVKKNTEEKNNQSVNLEYKKPEKSFITPFAVVSYLDKLIFENKRPLKALKFDIEEADSSQEILKFVNDSKLLSSDEKKDLVGLMGDQKIEENKISEKVVVPENIDEVLKESRSDYAEKLAQYAKKVISDKKVYEKLMADLGADKPMPIKGEPKDLSLAREEYLNTRNNKKSALSEQDISFDIEEVEMLREEFFSFYRPDAVNILNKAGKVWNKEVDDRNYNAISFVLGDTEVILKNKSVEAMKYDGLRTRPSEVPEKPAVEIDPLQKLVTVAESVNSNEEVFPSEFEGNNVVVIRGENDNPNILRVMFNDKEIAKGEITKKGLKIKIKSEFKAGWLFKKTMEHRAFDEKIMPFLKTFKI